MKMTLSNQLPPYPAFVEGIRRAPDRGYTLNPAQTATALKNALRYIPNELHRPNSSKNSGPGAASTATASVRRATSRHGPSTSTGDGASRARLSR